MTTVLDFSILLRNSAIPRDCLSYGVAALQVIGSGTSAPIVLSSDDEVDVELFLGER